ncbi:MAG TPA: hypothetical protein PKD55_01145, partial [Bellilinea sp.]|nr:hypothetical protein [Bellilinea sp.]
ILAIVGIILNWYGDSLDGTVARYRRIERPRYGFFMDHATDAVSSIFIIGGLGISPYFDFTIAMLGLVAWLCVNIVVHLTMISTGVFKISMGRFGPTEFRVIGIIAIVLIFFLGTLPLPQQYAPYTWYDVGMIAIAIILMGIFLQQTLSIGIQLSNQDNYTRERRRERERLKAERMANREEKKQARIARKKLKAVGRHPTETKS